MIFRENSPRVRLRRGRGLTCGVRLVRHGAWSSRDEVVLSSLDGSQPRSVRGKKIPIARRKTNQDASSHFEWPLWLRQLQDRTSASGRKKKGRVQDQRPSSVQVPTTTDVTPLTHCPTIRASVHGRIA